MPLFIKQSYDFHDELRHNLSTSFALQVKPLQETPQATCAVGRDGSRAPLGTSSPRTARVPHAWSSRSPPSSTWDTLAPKTSAHLNQTRVRPYLKILGNHFHWGVFTSSLIPRMRFDGCHVRTPIFISDMEKCRLFGFAVAWLC